jgi:hypothetical protein
MPNLAIASSVFGGTGGGSGSTETVSEIRFAIGTGASQSSASAIPAGAHVFGWQIDVDPNNGGVPFSSGTIVDLGQLGSTKLVASNQAPTVAGLLSGVVDVLWGASARAVLASVRLAAGGQPAAGAGVVIIQYSTTVNS